MNRKGVCPPQGVRNGNSITKDSDNSTKYLQKKEWQDIMKNMEKNTSINKKYKMSSKTSMISVFGFLFFFAFIVNCTVNCEEVNGEYGVTTMEITTTEFDPSTRGNKKFSDRCDNTQECGFAGSVCDQKMKVCQCASEVPATNHIDKCGKEASVNESCFFNEQCEESTEETECRDGRCICRFDKIPISKRDGSVECTAVKNEPLEPIRYVDPTMIGVLVAMALMFIIICVVLRMFSRARWRENRSIFNTPNPRLMNVSLLHNNKLLHGQERRGSRMSVRVPSRQPSMASLRPHSPNASIGSRRGSHGSSNASGASNKSNQANQQLLAHNQTEHRNSHVAAHGPIGHHGHQTTPLIERYMHTPHPQPVELVYHQQNLRRNSIQHQQHFPPQHPHSPHLNHHRVENVKVEITEVKP